MAIRSDVHHRVGRNHHVSAPQIPQNHTQLLAISPILFVNNTDVATFQTTAVKFQMGCGLQKSAAHNCHGISITGELLPTIANVWGTCKPRAPAMGCSDVMQSSTASCRMLKSETSPPPRLCLPTTCSGALAWHPWLPARAGKLLLSPLPPSMPAGRLPARQSSSSSRTW